MRSGEPVHEAHLENRVPVRRPRRSAPDAALEEASAPDKAACQEQRLGRQHKDHDKEVVSVTMQMACWVTHPMLAGPLGGADEELVPSGPAVTPVASTCRSLASICALAAGFVLLLSAHVHPHAL
jgi:hypothetical protein